MSELKIFQLNEYEAWYGPDFESVIVEAVRQTGVQREELLDGAHEILYEDYKDRILLCDENDPDNGLKIPEVLEKLSGIGVFWCSEY